MKLDHRDGHIHRGGSSDGGGSSSGLKVPQQHADSEPHPGHTTPTTPHPSADPHPPGTAPEGETSVCDMMASRLSHLDRMANWREAWNPRLSMSLASTKGLMNAPGDNNCFLNSAVQVLWHLDVFRRSFRLLSGHACMGNGCIFCTLKVLFTQLQYSDRSTLPPDALRRALASSFQDQHRFQLGHMDDAAECFENILTRIHYHIANETSEDSCKQLHCIPHQKFAMNIVEQILCQCGATTEPLPFTQMVHYVSANALVSQAKLLPHDDGPQGSMPRTSDLFGQLLRNATSEGDVRNCPSNCGEKVKIRKSLMNAPDVVSIGLIWDSDRPTLDHIKDVVRSIGTTIHLPDLFHSVSDVHGQHSTTLHLVGVVCYYGKHYSTFFFHSKMKKWVYFDDAHVKEMGPAWNNVADKCCRGHYQPLLLLYANPDCEPVETHTAPDVTTKLPGYQHFNQGVNQEKSGEHRSRRKDVPPSHQQQYGQYESGRHAQTANPNLRRSMTPGPEHRHLEQHSIPRRAITPGPEYGRYNSDEDETDAPAGVAHFRQSSYLIAVDGTPGAPGSGEKMPRSKTATHGGDPYFSAQRGDVPAQSRPVQNGIHQARPNNLYGQNNGSHAVMAAQQGYSQGHYQGQPQGRPQGHSQRPVQGQDRPTQGQHGYSGNNGQQYQYVAPQTHPPPVAQKPRTTQPPPREQHQQQQHQQQHQQQQQQQHQQLPKPSEYQDWTLSTSEPYRRQNMPKSPEPKAPESRGPEPTESTGFVYPTSPSKNKTTPSLAKVNEIQRLESFKKGKAIGADVIRYQNSPTEKPTSTNPYGPLDPEALYPGHESGVMQTAKGGQPVGGRMPASQSHPALKSEVVVQQQQLQQQQGPHTTNLKRTRSLENTADPAPVGGQHPTAVVHQSGAVTTGRTRPHSARPFDSHPPQQQVPPTTPKLGAKRGNNAYQGAAQQPASRPQQPNTDVVDGKPPRGTSSRTGPNWQEEDPYGTLQYINRRAVESVLTYQHQKPGGNTSSRVRTLSQGGPGSVGSRSSNSSLESATEQLARAAGALPPRPALPEALRVEIPGDNVSLGSHKDSGYRSGSSGGGDRNSASSMSSVSVDSPGSTHVPYHQQQREQVVHRGQYGQPQHPQLQQTMAYANPETKSHSSTDSLSSGQSGQSYATVRAAHGQPKQQVIPPHPQQQPPQPPRPQQQQPPLATQQQRPNQHQQQQQQPQYPNQQYPIPPFQYQSQQQQQQQHPQHQASHVNPYAHRQPDVPSRGAGGSRAPGGQRSHPPSAEDPQAVIFKAETLMEELNQKEKVGDLPAAMAVCTQAISCLQQAINNPNTNSEIKAYLRMKHNTCLLRSRSLHVRLTASHESVSASDLSAEDHGSISSQSTDGDVRDLIDSPQHRNHQAYHHYPGSQHFPAPGSAAYEHQYSSDSGYSSHSMEVTQQQFHMPLSYTDEAIADHRHQKQQQQQGNANRDWNAKSSAIQQKHEQTYEDNESNNKTIEMYATLPRKRTPKTKMLPAMPVRADKDNEAEVYQVYLQRQKEAAHQRQQEGMAPQGQHQQGYAPPQQQQQPAQHVRQTSNSGKMNKEQIKHLLIHDFMARKEGKVKDDVQPQVQPEVKQEHNRIRHMLTSELSHQMKGVSIKDAKRAQSEMNLHQVDQVDYHHHHQKQQPGDYGQHEHPARGYMVHPDSRQDDVPAGVYHSRESSCSSTTTIKAHSRENSLTSPPLSPKQNYSAAPAPGGQQPAWRGAAPPHQQGSVIDRDNNPPKPSMIGKLDKMHQQQAHHQQQQQQWVHQPGVGWQAAGAVTKPAGIRKSVSHTQLPMYDNALLQQSSIHAPICTGQADWTARSEGDVTNTEGVSQAMAAEMTGQDPAEFDCDEQFPPPPPEMLHFDDDEPLPPPPPELLQPHLDQQVPPDTKTTKPVVPSKPKPPPKPVHNKAVGKAAGNGCSQQQQRPQNPQLQHSVSEPVSLTQHTTEAATDTPSAKRIGSVSALVANIEGSGSNTMAIHRKPPHPKMKPQQTNSTFSTFFAPPDDANSGDRSSLSSVDSNSLNGLPPNGRVTRAFESDSSSCQASTGSNMSTTDCEPGAEHTRQQPKRPRSAMKKKREGRQRRKSVTFSDNVALVVDQEEVAQSQAIDYIQYVSKVLEQSKRPKSQGPPMGQNHDRTKVSTDSQVVGSGGEPDIIDPAFPNGYDSDFDEDTASSASSTDGGDAAQTRCSLCSKKVVEIDQLYCVNCKLYMSRFQPTNTEGTPAS